MSSEAMVPRDLVSILGAMKNRSSFDAKTFILDCRNPQEFKESHIRNSFNVSLPSLIHRRLRKGSISIKSALGARDHEGSLPDLCPPSRVILIAEEPGECPDGSLSSVLEERLLDDGCCVNLLQGGFTAFRARYPDFCESNPGWDGVSSGEGPSSDVCSVLPLRNLCLKDDQAYCRCDSGSEEIYPECSGEPSWSVHRAMDLDLVEIIPYCFLSNAHCAEDRDLLASHGIRYILNVTADLPNVFESEGQFEYLRVPISDHLAQDMMSYFLEAISFINKARSTRTGVLIHCLAGISRSVTIAVAYLMHTLSLSMEDAFDLIKAKKPNIAPNFSFMGQLLDFQTQLCNLDSEDSGRCSSSSSTDS